MGMVVDVGLSRYGADGSAIICANYRSLSMGQTALSVDEILAITSLSICFNRNLVTRNIFSAKSDAASTRMLHHLGPPVIPHFEV